MDAILYNHISKVELEDILQMFHAYTGLPIQIIDDDGNTLLACGNSALFCKKLHQFVFSKNECIKNYRDAAVYAQRFGEAYIFSCHANLNHIAFALSYKNELLAMVLIGPFLMDHPDATLLADFPWKNNLSVERLLDLYDELSNIKILSTELVHPLGKLVAYVFSPLLPITRQIQIQKRERLHQQSRISETIQQIKFQQAAGSVDESYKLEKELIQNVKKGDVQEAKGVLNELLGIVFFAQGGNLTGMKSRAVGLCTLLSRVAIEAGAGTGNAFRLNDGFLTLLQQATTLEELCQQMQEVVEAFVDSALSIESAVDNAVVRKAMRYIRQHYTENLQLGNVASYVNVSPAYFSSLFRRWTGNGFKSYLNHLRIEESKRMLIDTDEAIVDIAIAMGFSDQSYFTKVFKRHTGLSPNQYR